MASAPDIPAHRTKFFTVDERTRPDMRAALADEGVVILQKKERMSEQDGCAAGRELSLIFQETLSLSVYKPQCVEKISDPPNEISNEEYVHSRRVAYLEENSVG